MIIGRKKVKILNYISDVVHHYHDDTFKSHFRMKRQTFSWLVQKLAPFLEKDGPGHPMLNPEKSLLVTLWLLASLETYRSVQIALTSAFLQLYIHLTK